MGGNAQAVETAQDDHARVPQDVLLRLVNLSFFSALSFALCLLLYMQRNKSSVLFTNGRKISPSWSVLLR